MNCNDSSTPFPEGTLVIERKDAVSLRLRCKTKEDFMEWLQEYQERSKLTFRTERRKPAEGKYVIFKSYFRCHHNTKPRGTGNPSKKHTGCPVVMNVTIKKVGKKCRSKDAHIQTHPTQVVIHNDHNHRINSAEALKYRDPSEEVKKKFLDLFKSGNNASQALELHKKDLMEEHDNYLIASADRSLCPDLQWVYRLYYQMCNEQFGASTCNKDMLQSHETKVKEYQKPGVEVSLTVLDEDFVPTPLIQCVRSLKSSGSTAFLDSSGNSTLPVDAGNRNNLYWIATGRSDVPDGWFGTLDFNSPQKGSSIFASTDCRMENTDQKEKSTMDFEEQSEGVNNGTPTCTAETNKVNLKKDLLGFVEDLMTHYERHPSAFKTAITSFLESKKKMVTESSLLSALHCFGKSHTTKTRVLAGRRASTIPVQPTAVSRRKSALLGRRCVGSGHTPKNSFIAEHGYSMTSVKRELFKAKNERKRAAHNLAVCGNQNVALG